MPLEKAPEKAPTTIEKAQNVEDYLTQSREARAKEAETYFNKIDSQSLDSLRLKVKLLYDARNIALDFVSAFRGTKCEEFAISDFAISDMKYLCALNDYLAKEREAYVKEHLEKYPTQEQYQKIELSAKLIK